MEEGGREKEDVCFFHVEIYNRQEPVKHPWVLSSNLLWTCFLILLNALLVVRQWS